MQYIILPIIIIIFIIENNNYIINITKYLLTLYISIQCRIMNIKYLAFTIQFNSLNKILLLSFLLLKFWIPLKIKSVLIHLVYIFVLGNKILTKEIVLVYSH